jgi:hypothetical protein
MNVKIIRRTDKHSYRVGENEFYRKTLEAVELHYAPNHALRLTREELRGILAALRPDLDYCDGVIDLIRPPEPEPYSDY